MGSQSDWHGWDAEDHLLDFNEWDQAPPEVIERAEALLGERLPVGIAKHPKHGWMILMSMATGPSVAWMGNDDRGSY